jgi:hypothetical protein
LGRGEQSPFTVLNAILKIVFMILGIVLAVLALLR